MMPPTLPFKVLVSKDVFIHSYKSKWRGENGASFLGEMSVFDEEGLKYSSPSFPFVHLLGLYVYFAGSLERVYSKKRFFKS